MRWPSKQPSVLKGESRMTDIETGNQENGKSRPPLVEEALEVYLNGDEERAYGNPSFRRGLLIIISVTSS